MVLYIPYYSRVGNNRVFLTTIQLLKSSIFHRYADVADATDSIIRVICSICVSARKTIPNTLLRPPLADFGGLTLYNCYQKWESKKHILTNRDSVPYSPPEAGIPYNQPPPAGGFGLHKGKIGIYVYAFFNLLVYPPKPLAKEEDLMFLNP